MVVLVVVEVEWEGGSEARKQVIFVVGCGWIAREKLDENCRAGTYISFYSYTRHVWHMRTLDKDERS